MKKVQLLFLIILYVIFTTNLFAQDSADTPPKKYKWELNVNANHLLFPSYKVDFYPVHYFVRMKKQNENAWRFSLIPQLSKSLQVDDLGFFGINLGVGHEWAKTKGKLRVYWGSGSNVYYDRFTGYIGNGASQQPPPPIFVNPDTYRSTSFLISLQGFVGMQYYLSKSIAVSLESKSILYYRYVRVTGIDGSFNDFVNGIDWQQFPVGGIFVSYQL
jgi:hypothetical protein